MGEILRKTKMKRYIRRDIEEDENKEIQRERY